MELRHQSCTLRRIARLPLVQRQARSGDQIDGKVKKTRPSSPRTNSQAERNGPHSSDGVEPTHAQAAFKQPERMVGAELPRNTKVQESASTWQGDNQSPSNAKNHAEINQRPPTSPCETREHSLGQSFLRWQLTKRTNNYLATAPLSAQKKQVPRLSQWRRKSKRACWP